jgi:radical SAM-linked protein
MIGLPYEVEGDLLDIIDLAGQIIRLAGRKRKKANLNVSISTFVPKAHTPFMWATQVSLEESRRRIHRIQDGLRRNPLSGIRVKWNQPELSWLEGIFSRGDRRLGPVVMEAWRLGAKFDAWGEHFRKEVWEEAFARCGLDPDLYLYRERSVDEILPWDHIQSGVTKAFLRKEWIKAGQAESTPDCRHHCLECGVCDHHGIDPVLHPCSGIAFDPASPGTVRPSPESVKKCRIAYRKLKRARHLSHLELVRVFVRAFHRAGLELAFSRGYHPMPKISFFSALPVGTESMEELMQVELLDPVDVSALKERINAELPEGVEVTLADEIPPSEKRVHIVESRFQITLNGLRCKEKDLEKFLQSDYFPVVKTCKKGEHEIDVRSLVSDIALVPPDRLRLTVREREGPGLKPAEILKGIFSLSDEDLHKMEVMKTGQTLA